MTVALTILGAALIALVLRDVFHTLFRPGGNGRFGSIISRVLWQTLRHRPATRTVAGPTILVAVVVAWAALLVVGWALILWPRLPGEFLFATGLDPAAHDGFSDALYLSVVTLATLGYGDIVPRTGWLRLLMPLEAIVGFGLLTASISWVLSVYPVLSRRRRLARGVALLRDVNPSRGDDPVPSDPAEREWLLADLTSRLVEVREDFAQFPVTYYFHTDDPRSSLATMLPEILRLADAAQRPDRPPAVRLQGALLERTLADFAAILGEDFLNRPGASLSNVMAAYAADHPT